MSYLEILKWVNVALSVLSAENIIALFDLIESTMTKINEFLTKVGINPQLSENLTAEPSDDERACENEIALKLQAHSANVQGQFDFSRIRKLLKFAKDSGLLDVFMAALVPKVPLQLNALPDSQVANKEDKPVAVPSGISPPNLLQKK